MSLFCGAIAAAGQAQAQHPLTQSRAAQRQQVPVFRSAASLVALNVSVTDGRDYVTGLQRGDFAVFEDGVQQHIELFEAQDVPLDLILLLDTSSSMREQMSTVHTAASGFIGTLREHDRAAIVTFGDTVQIAQPLTSDTAVLKEAIRSTKGHGGTALHNALYIAFKEFGRAARQSGDVRRQAFVVLSDGQDTAGMLAFDDVLAEARRSGVTVYTINLRSDIPMHLARVARQASEAEFAMRRLAQETGGQAFLADKVGELRGIYAGIAQEISRQYSIGYIPSNNAADGRFRRIVVRVTSRPNLRPRARTGYVADGVAVAAALPPLR